MSEDRYLQYDPFEGDRDVDVKMRAVKMVTTRTPQACLDPNKGKLHPIPPGTRARHERALVDGKWGSYYVCIPCMDRWLANFDDDCVNEIVNQPKEKT